jgi:hypothetical protein
MTENDKSIKDKSINDVTKNTKRVAREAKDAVVDKAEDVKDVTSDKLENLQERAENLRDDAAEHVNDFSVNEKLILTGAITLAVSLAVQALIKRVRTVKVDNSVVVEELVVVAPEDITDPEA